MVNMEEYSVGDKVKATDFYLSNYPAWDVKGKEATVVSVKKFIVKHSDLLKEDRGLYHGKYGIRMEYTVYDLHVELEGHTYVVSQFGFDK
jgi:hypothetical protein